MNFTALYLRFRWLQIPTGLLVMLLQRLPVLRVLTQAECAFEGGAGVVMKSVFALVALGTIDSVAGATMFGATTAAPALPATPASGPVGQQFAVSGTVNTALSVAFAVTGAPGSPRAWSMSGTLPPGLTMVGGSPVNVTAPYKMTISGTPTTPGSWTVTVTAWESSGAKGKSVDAFCVFTIANGSNAAPAFTTQPQNVSVNAGSAATFTAAASGTPTPTYQWFLGTTSLTGQTSTTLTLSNVQTANAGSYTVVATNSAGTATSSAATLVVQTAPSITTQPASVSVGTGVSTSFSVVAAGSAPLSYQWLKGGVNIAGATSSTYSIASAQTTDVGIYTVAVTNPAGSSVSNQATLTILAAPVIATQPQGFSVTVGGNAAFTVVASGAAPLSYQWQLGGVAISGATSATYTISNVQMSAAGSYAVVVTNMISSVTSSAATLTVTASAVAPTISTQPQNVTVTAGVSASFSVSAAGTAPLTYQWKKGTASITSATNATYTFASAQLTDAGSYSVVVTNSAGTATSGAATLTVNPALSAPTITTQPTSETVATGKNISFLVATTANPAASYQWSVSTNGGTSWTTVQDGPNAYAGATTGTLTVMNASSTMSGYLYRCTASNSSGSVNSSSLTMSVVAPIFPAPVGLAINGAGVIFVSDSSNNTIQSVSTSWQASVLAGTSGQQGTADGTGAAALFRQPGGVAIDSAGNLYLADTGNSIIRKITSAGVVTTLAGSASNQGFRDGVGTAAWFNSPAAIAVDGAGVLYVADSGNAVIRKIAVDGTVSTLAGTAGATGSTDGSGASARFNLPSGIALDAAGNLYVSDTVNQLIRKITAGGGVTTLAGVVLTSGANDGTGLAAKFNLPRGLCADSAGNLYVADTGNSAIRMVTASGNVTTIAGLSSVAGLLDGPGATAWLNQPKDVKIDAAGNLYVADTGNAAIRKITPATIVDTPVITVAAVTPPPPSSSSGGSSAPISAGTPPGKSGAGSLEGWFVLGLAALAAMARGWRK